MTAPPLFLLIEQRCLHNQLPINFFSPTKGTCPPPILCERLFTLAENGASVKRAFTTAKLTTAHGSSRQAHDRTLAHEHNFWWFLSQCSRQLETLRREHGRLRPHTTAHDRSTTAHTTAHDRSTRPHASTRALNTTSGGSFHNVQDKIPNDRRTLEIP